MIGIDSIRKSIFKKRSFTFLSIYFLSNILLLTSCANKNINNSYTDKPFVLTTFTILADLAENVAGERLEVKSITKPRSRNS
tara:strand:+ start:389 stop:634 length:246 start_codon:yes stop_codon:yes gene_type:complete